MTVSRRRFLDRSLRAAGALAAGSAIGCESVERTLLGGLGVSRPNGPSGPFVVPMGGEIDAVRHVLNRLSFGPRPEDYGRVRGLAAIEDEAVAAYIEEQLDPSSLDDTPAEWAVRRLETLDEPLGELFEYQPRLLLDELTRATVLRAITSRRQLFEVMVAFWSDHLNIDVSKGDCRWLKVADDREVIRPHALGRFPELLRASALSPAMLWYLDGRVNRKRRPEERPNENYARELLELHTLGVHGGYSQQDVMEVARCLTGWTVRSEERFFKGRVEFRPELHDDGEKTVLGHVLPAGGGREDLDRVLEIVSLHPATARHLAAKLCRRFIGEDPGAGAVESAESAFTRSAGDIPETLRAIFASEEFLHSAGTKLKRPFRFLVSALRATAAETDGGGKIGEYLLRMGHAPFQYPTPDGYPEDPVPWQGTLLWRWNFAVELAAGRLAGIRLDLERLGREMGGRHGVQSHLLGRSATDAEAALDSSRWLALTLASPDFQRY